LYNVINAARHLAAKFAENGAARRSRATHQNVNHNQAMPSFWILHVR